MLGKIKVSSCFFLENCDRKQLLIWKRKLCPFTHKHVSQVVWRTERYLEDLTSWQRPRRWKPALWHHFWYTWLPPWSLCSLLPSHLARTQTGWHYSAISKATLVSVMMVLMYEIKIKQRSLWNQFLTSKLPFANGLQEFELLSVQGPAACQERTDNT